MAVRELGGGSCCWLPKLWHAEEYSSAPVQVRLSRGAVRALVGLRGRRMTLLRWPQSCCLALEAAGVHCNR